MMTTSALTLAASRHLMASVYFQIINRLLFDFCEITITGSQDVLLTNTFNGKYMIACLAQQKTGSDSKLKVLYHVLLVPRSNSAWPEWLEKPFMFKIYCFTVVNVINNVAIKWHFIKKKNRCWFKHLDWNKFQTYIYIYTGLWFKSSIPCLSWGKGFQC